MFFFGMIENGPRGFSQEQPDDLQLQDEGMDGFGIDWDAYDNEAIRTHHFANNEAEDVDDNPFLAGNPRNLSEVEVIPPGCPLSQEQLDILHAELHALPYFTSRSMDMRRRVWIEALAICRRFF